jgi:hypothetical protein
MSLKKLCFAASAFILAATAYVSTSFAGNCPPPRHYSGSCVQVIVWAEDPDTKMCCQSRPPARRRRAGRSITARIAPIPRSRVSDRPGCGLPEVARTLLDLPAYEREVAHALDAQRS